MEHLQKCTLTLSGPDRAEDPVQGSPRISARCERKSWIFGTPGPHAFTIPIPHIPYLICLSLRLNFRSSHHAPSPLSPGQGYTLSTTLLPQFLNFLPFVSFDLKFPPILWPTVITLPIDLRLMTPFPCDVFISTLMSYDNLSTSYLQIGQWL